MTLKSCLTLCNPMNCSPPGFSIIHYLPEFAQTRVHWVSDAIQPSHPPLLRLSPQSFPAPGSFPVSLLLYQVAKVLERHLQHQSFQWIVKGAFLQNWLVWSPCCPRDPQESSPALQFESISFSALGVLYGPTLTSVHDYWKNGNGNISWECENFMNMNILWLL